MSRPFLMTVSRSIHTTLQLHCDANILITFSIAAFQVKMNLTFMRHRNAVTSQFLYRRVQCSTLVILQPYTKYAMTSCPFISCKMLSVGWDRDV